MAKFSPVSFKVPDIQKSYKYGSIDYSNPSVKEANIKMLQGINANYGNLIKFWSNEFEIPAFVTIGFIATESGGTMQKPNRYQATGLMQVTPASIYECFKKWNVEVDAPLPNSAYKEIQKKIPELIRAKTLTNPLKLQLLTLLHKDASFNIMSGCLVLRWLLDRFSTILSGGQLNKAMVAYNAGAYTKSLVTSGTKANLNPIDSTTLSQNRAVPSQSRDYLVKMLGKDGFLSLLYQQKAI